MRLQLHPLVVSAEIQAIATGSELLALLFLLARRKSRYLTHWTWGIGAYFLSSLLQVLAQLAVLPAELTALFPLCGVLSALALWLGGRDFLGLRHPGRRTLQAAIGGIVLVTAVWPHLAPDPIAAALPGALTLVGLLLHLGMTLLTSEQAAESAGVRLTGCAYVAHGGLIVLAPLAGVSDAVAIWGMTLSAVLTFLAGWGLLLMTIERSEGDLRRLGLNLAVQVAERDLALAQAERLASLGHAVATVAHETRNKLNLIQSANHLLGSDTVSAEIRSKARGRIARAVTDTAQMVGDVLQLARPRPPQTAPVDVCDLIAAILQATLPAAIELDRHALVDATWVMADRQQLEQVLLNVVINAVDAMPAGGTLTIRCEQDGRDVRLILADTGEGVNPEDLPHVFDTFFSTKAGGTGLGLAICRTLLQQQGGRITLGPGAAGGTEVEIRLPAAPPPA
jgi:signal transduction histidine kinase